MHVSINITNNLKKLADPKKQAKLLSSLYDFRLLHYEKHQKLYIDVRGVLLFVCFFTVES